MWTWIAVVVVLIALRGRTVFATKPGVQLGHEPAMEYARRIVARVWHRYGYTLTVTSGFDGTHSARGKHQLGLAEDYRIRDVRAGDLGQMIADVRSVLGRDYDVVRETDHLHVEYDPK